MKSAIITGASRGIGQATALKLADQYDYIAICSHLSHDTLKQTADSIHANTNGSCICHAFTGDISDYQFVKAMVETIISEAGSIETLINNAGISSVGLFSDMTPSEWKRILDVNLTSIFNTCNCVIPHMVHKKRGNIINISSVWGLVGASCEVAYSATKGAINSLTKALAKELAPSNISVNAIAFGAIDTSMNNHLDFEELSSLADEIPAGRLGTVDEAALCIDNILHMPSYFTGEIVKFDGGWI